MAEDRDERALEIAAFRYRLIAEALELSSDDAVSAVLSRIASATHSDPWGRPFQCKVRTLWRYLRAYRSGGLLALRPPARKDRGELRALDPEILSRAVALRRTVLSRSTSTLIDILVRERRVQEGQIARSTLDRHLRRLGCTRRVLRNLGQKV